MSAIRAAVWDVLDGRCMLREEIAEQVVKRVGPRPRQRLLSGFAWFFDELCQGPAARGTKTTLVRPDQWINGWQEVDEDPALLEACRRYLRTYGPARPEDFGEWFGGRAFKNHARAVFDSLHDELEEIDVEGRRAYVLAGDTAFPSVESSLRLLPDCDVYIMGFREREHLVPEPVRKQVAAHPRGRYEGPAGVRFVIINGLAAGLWERKKRGKRLDYRSLRRGG